MNQSKRRFIKLTKRDIGLLLGIGTLAAILNVYPYPLVAAGAVVIGILLLRIYEEPEENKEIPVRDDRSVEKRSAEEIITSKLNEGAIEKAIDERFDNMVKEVVDDLFGNYGEVSRQIKTKLKETMNPYIEAYDFSEHTIKLEHLLSQLITGVTKDQDTLLRNLRDMMGTEPVAKVSTSELFDKYTSYISENIDTNKLDIDYDDKPTYRNLTAELSSEDNTSSIATLEKKSLAFTCEEDESMTVIVGIKRWTDLSDNAWHIESVERVNTKESVSRVLRGDNDLTRMETPMRYLRDLNKLEVCLLKLYYDRTEIILDETDIYDEDVEVKAEPEASFY
ncbi:hypothetical protein [Evansella clarkii]|uniref:hypothetical protein n=1 Tax=Evansella clarkii TaxID=79879 RepID=UPI000996752C|nr:hypothetical protein [Evansella clarkii]